MNFLVFAVGVRTNLKNVYKTFRLYVRSETTKIVQLCKREKS